MSSLKDQIPRDAFVQNVRGSYSVIAPAGVGKTESIIRRIAQLALLPRIDPGFSLSQLVVVTYTKAAAAEMRERARLRLLKEAHSPEIMAQFNQGFFGTIHSYCDGIAREWGPRVGLRSDFEIETDSEALFVEFMRSESDLMRLMPDEWRDSFVRLVDVWKVLECLKNPDALEKATDPVDPGPCPVVDISAVLNAKMKSGRSTPKLDRYKESLQAWLERWHAGGAYTGLPDSYSNDQIRAAFGESCKDLFEWVSKAAIYWLLKVDLAFFEYRCRIGRLYFSDTVRVVNQLLKDGRVADLLYLKSPYIILDEAQDTDPAQFKMLLGMCGVRFEGSGPLQVRDAASFSKGRWCMVGDFQQSIYKNRADVSLYQEIHDRLVDEGLVEGLTFSVTFRCDEAIVSWVNQSIEPVFKKVDAESRVDFVPLMPRPDATVGVVGKIRVEAVDEDVDAEIVEAENIARVVDEAGLVGLGIDDWNQCAMLCPRKAQLTSLEKALKARGIEAQKLSDSRTYLSLPEYAWPVALLKIMSDPEDAFEIASVLREIFGISDQAIYQFVHEAPKLIEGLADSVSEVQIRKPSPLGGVVPDVLNHLYQLRQTFGSRSHIAAVDGLFAEAQLSDRLRVVLGEESKGKIEAAVTRISLEAISLYEKYGSWTEVVDSLHKTFLQQAVEVDEAKEGHVQLLTCHKSKGLQWDVVILPYLWKGISKPQESYPSLVGIQRPSQVGFVASASDPGKVIVQQRDLEAVNELRRLLYVAVTRAKHALLLVDDRVLFEKSRRGLTSFGALLEEGGSDALVGLEDFGSLGVSEVPSSVVDSVTTPESQETTFISKVQFKDRSILKRMLPSSLSHEADTGSREVLTEALDMDVAGSAGRARGAEYGTWWHDFMEAIWAGRTGAFPEFKSLEDLPKWALCPDKVRGAQEFSKLLSHRDLKAHFGESSLVLCELPFLWKDPESNNVYDGYVDFVLKDRESGEWILIDWKTDVLDEESGLTGLSNNYAAQLIVYRKALSATWGIEGKSFLFSTRLGDWVEV